MSKKNKKIQLPKRSPLLYLLIILVPVVLFFAIAIPVKYVSTYKEQRVYVFENTVYNKTTEDKTDKDGHTHTHTTYEKKENVVWGDIDTITDFDLYLYCNEYNEAQNKSIIEDCLCQQLAKELLPYISIEKYVYAPTDHHFRGEAKYIATVKVVEKQDL